MKRTLCITIALAGLAPACAKEPPVRILCELSIAKSLSQAQPAELTFTLTNAGAEVVQVLNWQTPFEGIKGPMFDITRDGTEVDYHGPMLKRGAPHKEDYLILKPGERRQSKIDLDEGWAVAAPGNYTVEYAVELFDVVAGSSPTTRSLDEFNAVTLDCNSVSFTRGR